MTVTYIAVVAFGVRSFLGPGRRPRLWLRQRRRCVWSVLTVGGVSATFMSFAFLAYARHIHFLFILITGGYICYGIVGTVLYLRDYDDISEQDGRTEVKT